LKFSPEDDLGSLYEKLWNWCETGLKTCKKRLRQMKWMELPQDESKAMHHAPKIFKETGEIDWRKNRRKPFINLIRAFTLSAAWTHFGWANFCKIF